MLRKGIIFDEDTQLMLQASRGNVAAFDMLYRKYYEIVINYLMSFRECRESAEDIAQSVFACIWAGRGKFRADAAFKTYICSIARNILFKKRIAQSRVTEINCDIFHGCFKEPILSEPDKYFVEYLAFVREAVSLLTVKQKEAVDLFYYEKLSLYCAADKANCSVHTFASRLYRARRKIKGIFEEEGL